MPKQLQWERVLVADQWKNGKFIERNRIRKNYYEQVVLPNAIAQNKDVNTVKGNFYAKTHKDLGQGEKHEFTFPKSSVFQDDGRLPEFDGQALKAVKDFIDLGLNTRAPGFGGVTQGAIGNILPAIGKIPGVHDIATGIGEGLEGARRAPRGEDGKIKFNNVLNNLIQGGVKATLYAPEFFAHVASDPINATAGLAQFGIEVTDRTVGAISYLAGTAWGYDVNNNSMKKFRKDFDDILTRPEEPLMTFMMGTGMLKGVGKLKNASAADLIHRANAGEMKPVDLAPVKQATFTPNLNVSNTGVKPMTPKQMGKRLSEIDNNVTKFMNDNVPLPENYADGVLTRSAKRVGFEAGDVIHKAKTSGNLSRSAMELRDEFSMQADRVARQMGKGTEEFLLERQREMDAFENHVQKEIDAMTSVSAKQH